MTRSIALLTLMTLMLASPAHASDEPETHRELKSRASANHVDLKAWAYSDSKATNSSARSASAVRLLRAYVPACEGNWPEASNNLGTLCPQATEMCAGTPEDDLGFWVFTAPAGSGPRNRQSWTPTGEYACRSVTDGDPAAVEPVVTAADFRRLPIPAAGVNVQPPDRRTLVNIPTNLYADADAVVLPTTVLGQPVRVRATPLRFHWSYGDGTTLTTADPGAPYPDLRTAHTYRRPGNAALSLTTTYRGEYSVAGGPWLPIDGVASVDSPGTALTVLSAENQLVADPIS